MLHNLSRELELSDRLETDYLRILYYEFPNQISDNYNTYEYPRLCTIIEGEKSISVNKEAPFKYDNSQFLLLPAESNVHMTIKESTRALVFELSDTLVENVSRKVSVENDLDYDLLIKDQVLCAKESTDFRDVLNKTAKLLLSKDRNMKYILDLFAQELVCSLIQIKGADLILNCDADSPVNEAIHYMKENYMRPVSINEIARSLGMSESGFCQYFKKITGVSPKEFLTNIRMEKAKNLIINTNVTEAALDLGYENISHFITLFKEKYGLTPKQYQVKESKNHHKN